MSTAQEIRRRVRAEEQARAKQRERAAVAAGVAAAAVTAAVADSSARLERLRVRYEAAVAAERQRITDAECSAGAALRDAVSAGYSDADLCELLGIEVAEARRWMKHIKQVGHVGPSSRDRARDGVERPAAQEPQNEGLVVVDGE